MTFQAADNPDRRAKSKLNYLTLDIGTTSIKGIVYDSSGKVKSKVVKNSRTISRRSGWMEKDCDEVLGLTIEVIKYMIASVKDRGGEIGFLSLSCFMHGIFAVDKAGNAISPCMLWSDGRSAPYSKRYQENGIGLALYRKTGTPVHPMSPLYKLMWLRDNEPDVFRRAHKFISIKEYLLNRMCGVFHVDESVASATGLFDIESRSWCEECLKEIGIDDGKLSQPVSAMTVYSALTDSFRRLVQSEYDFPVVIGASDGCLANLGSHGLVKNSCVVTLGTSGAVRITGDRPLTDDKGRTFSYVLSDGLYVSGGATNNGAVVYEWLREVLGQGLDLDDLLAQSPPGGRGLIFLPFLSGERAPYWNAGLRGSWLGLERSHSRADLLRSAIEGVCFSIRDVFEVLVSKGLDVSAVYCNGGFTRSESWIRILAQVMGRKIEVFEQGEAACFGAFLLGLRAVGAVSDWDECGKMFRSRGIYDPDPGFDYQALFDLYREAVLANVSLMERLTELQQTEGR